MTPRSTPEDARYRRPDASMSLLINIMDHSLDEGYAEATARRAVRGEGGALSKAPAAKLLVALGVGLIAIVVTMAAIQVRAAAPQAEKERQDLINRIHTREDAADKLQDDVSALRDRVDGLQDRNLTPEAVKRVELLAMVTGADPVEGPGLKVVVDDAPQSTDQDGANKDPRAAESLANGRVLDRDLQRVVNGLWEAGAEAMGINGQRLTALSAIRAAGASILVDNRPLSPPYTVLAIGNGKKMQVAFQDGKDGRYLHALSERYGIRATIGTQKTIKLPAAIGLTLHVAQPEGAAPPPSTTPTPQPAPAPSGTPTTGTVSPTPTPGATGGKTPTGTATPRTPTPSKTGKPTGSGRPSNNAAARTTVPAPEEGQA
ncbi:DUF881 domain-containing protein [Yinghuangia seranimata]|uniref:DUF881 domain-containing protein n=1 Tax=Yinghuangia seranimata TaxID=408067 RepID=UPI00248A9528|nr:DUF881 domain-containing protein [Yinghuangia seranimata]MDI2129709.1 DUF881 domain-containing protein [Yinghuangia seranimata]